jgi:hypothetical protein
MKAVGLMDLAAPTDFTVPDPAAAIADEDPLEAETAPEFHRDYLAGEEA